MKMTGLDDEIAWWTEQAKRSTSDAWLIAIGIRTGLLIAKGLLDDEARDRTEPLTPPV